MTSDNFCGSGRWAENDPDFGIWTLTRAGGAASP